MSGAGEQVLPRPGRRRRCEHNEGHFYQKLLGRHKGHYTTHAVSQQSAYNEPFPTRRRVAVNFRVADKSSLNGNAFYIPNGANGVFLCINNIQLQQTIGVVQNRLSNTKLKQNSVSEWLTGADIT